MIIFICWLFFPLFIELSGFNRKKNLNVIKEYTNLQLDRKYRRKMYG